MILLIDDDSVFSGSLIREIRERGHKVLLAKSPEEAIDTVRKENKIIDMILLDIMMPSGDMFSEKATQYGLYTGLLLLAAIRIVLPDVPVFVVSIMADDKVVEKVRSFPNCEIFRKTATFDDLLNRVDDILNRRGQYLLERLPHCAPGWSFFRSYETLCVDILNYLFVPPFPAILEQSQTRGRHEVRDAIIPNTSPTVFWTDLKHEFDSKHIPWEFKNYTKPIGAKEVLQMRRRLSKVSIGRFGVLLSRLSPSESALRERYEAYRSHPPVLILLIDDALIKEMIKCKLEGGDPGDVLSRLKREFELSY